MWHTNRDRATALEYAVAGATIWIVVAWLLRPRGLDDLDGANFVHALSHYDLSSHMPHFPGYPVYIGVARASSALGIDALSALQWPGLAAWAASLVALFAAVRRHGSPVAAWVAMGVTGLAPLAFLSAGRASSDALGSGLLILSASLLALWVPARSSGAPQHVPSTWRRGALCLALVLAGLVPGVRASLLPAAAMVPLAAWLLMADARPRVVAWFALGVGLWFVPFVWVAGPELVPITRDFLAGHFLSWGGSVAVTGEPLGRAVQWIELLLVHVLGVPAAGGHALRWVAGPAALFALAAALFTANPKRVLIAVGLCSPYLLWLWLGQNPEKPRHLLPLVPVVAVGIGIGVAGLNTVPRAVVSGALACLLVVTLGLGWDQRVQLSPPAQLASWLPEHYPLEGTQVFAGQSERVLGVLQPAYRVEYASDQREVSRRLETYLHRPSVVLVTDEVEGASGRPVAVFERNPLVHPHGWRVTLYEVTP